jgi:hypothetical protein
VIAPAAIMGAACLMRRDGRMKPAARPRSRKTVTGSSPCAAKRGIQRISSGSDTSKRSTAARRATSKRKACTICAMHKAAQSCRAITAGLVAPHQVQPQLPLDQFDRQLEVPASPIDPRHLRQRQKVGIADIGQVGMDMLTHAELHQPHGVLGAIRPVRTEPDEAIEGLAAPVVGLDHIVTRPRPQAREPPIARIGQVIEPLEAEVAQVRHNQRARREPRDHRPGGDLLVLAGIGTIGDAPPLLKAQVEHAREGAAEQTSIAGGQGAQGGQEAGHRIEGALIEGDDGGEGGRGPPRPAG